MGQQPSTLNCKINENNQKHEAIHTKEFFTRKKKPFIQTQTHQDPNPNFPTENVISPTSPRTQMTRATSQKNISSNSSRQLTKLKTFLPEHQAITKVSQVAFKGSVKGKKMYVEDKLKSLAEIVESRYNTPKHFPYSQILSLTQSLVYGLAYMAKKKCNHHDFYPTNIYYSEGRFKIINPLELPCSGFYLTCQRQRFSFLSPELIIAILEQIPESDLGEEMMSKSDVFAIGMILLEVCSLQPSSECYDEESYNIVDAEVIKERLAKVVKVYTPVIAECINMMLQYEAQARIDPINLAQLVHWKIENQKLIAIQIEAPKQLQQAPLPQQVHPGPPGKRIMPPSQNLPPQQIRAPPPPYMHQPFMMQNLNPNVIAVSLPNEQFARIGPNNQGFLSSSSLQQKLRVIELIKQHPTEDEQEQGEKESKIQEKSSIEVDKREVERKEPGKAEMRNVFVEKEDLKPQYPFVESIYSEKPLMETNFETELKPQPSIVNKLRTENRQQILGQPESARVQAEPVRVAMVRQPLNFGNNLVQPIPYQVHEFHQRKMQSFVREEVRPPLIQGYDERSVQILRGEEIKPRSPMHVYGEIPMHVYGEIPKQQVFSYHPQNYVKSESQLPAMSSLSPMASERIQIKVEAKGQFAGSQSYGTSVAKNPSTINNIYTMGQPSNIQTGFGQIQNQGASNDSGQSLAKKYGTSFQSSSPTQNPGQSIEERVQRVLNMSRNAK